MTVEQRNKMKKALTTYCYNHLCKECPLHHNTGDCYRMCSDETLYDNYMRVFGNLENNNKEGDKMVSIEAIKEKYGCHNNHIFFDGYVRCVDCPIPRNRRNYCDHYNTGFDDCYKSIQNYLNDFEKEDTTEPSAVTSNDPTNPKHYKREGGVESIEEMIAVFGREAVAHFCLCNVWKYRYRAADKNGEEDINKSDWYMRKYLELTNKVGGVAHE